jgi:hypothetical protein
MTSRTTNTTSAREISPKAQVAPPRKALSACGRASGPGESTGIAASRCADSRAEERGAGGRNSVESLRNAPRGLALRSGLRAGGMTFNRCETLRRAAL